MKCPPAHPALLERCRCPRPRHDLVDAWGGAMRIGHRGVVGCELLLQVSNDVVVTVCLCECQRSRPVVVLLLYLRAE